MLARPGVVLLAAKSKAEIEPLGYVDRAVLVDEDAWANFSFSADNLVNYLAWSVMIGQLGERNTRALVYDDGELKFASLRFLLAHFGVTDANLINGGFAAMQPLIASGALKLRSHPSVPIPRTFTAHKVQNPIPIVFRHDVAAAALSKPPTAKLVDVRTPGEFDGTILIPPDTRGGHSATTIPPGSFTGSGFDPVTQGVIDGVSLQATTDVLPIMHFVLHLISARRNRSDFNRMTFGKNV